MFTKTKEFYSKLTSQDKKLIAKIAFCAIIAIVLIVLGINYATRDKTKELQQEQIDYANEQIEILKDIWTKADNKEKQAKEEKKKSNEEQDRLRGCIKENSKTGIVADCEEFKLIPTASADSSYLFQEPKSRDKIIMDRVCKYAQINGKISPLCGNDDLYGKLKTISEERGVNFYLMLGIAFSESHIGVNFSKDNAGGTCDGRNNWGGVKWRMDDNGTVYKDKPVPDEFNCWLYKFDSIEEYWKSKANSLKFGYVNKQCSTPDCISKWYVRGNGIVKPYWVDRVNVFYQ